MRWPGIAHQALLTTCNPPPHLQLSVVLCNSNRRLQNISKTLRAYIHQETPPCPQAEAEEFLRRIDPLNCCNNPKTPDRSYDLDIAHGDDTKMARHKESTRRTNSLSLPAEFLLDYVPWPDRRQCQAGMGYCSRGRALRKWVKEQCSWSFTPRYWFCMAVSRCSKILVGIEFGTILRDSGGVSRVLG